MRSFVPYFRLLKAVRKPLIAAILCGVIYGLANGAGLPLMVKEIFPRIFGEQARELSRWELIGVALWLPLIFTIRGIAGYANAYFIQYAGVRVLEALRIEYFDKLQRLPLSFFGRSSMGDLIARGLGDTAQLQNTLIAISNEIIKQPATLLGAFGYLTYLAFTEHGTAIVLLSLSIIPICIFPVRYIGRKVIEKARVLQSQAGSLTDRFTENLSAVREVRAFSLESMEVGRFRQRSQAMLKAQMKVAKYAQALAPVIEI